jgi:hypothetical protein
MWFHLDHRQERKPHYHWRLVAVATADHPNGPFHLHHAFHPSGLPSLDISLYQLPADDNAGNKAHDAFLLRAIDNKYIGASKLRDDFLDVAGGGSQPDPRFPRDVICVRVCVGVVNWFSWVFVDTVFSYMVVLNLTVVCHSLAAPAVSILTQGRREAPALFRSNGQ